MKKIILGISLLCLSCSSIKQIDPGFNFRNSTDLAHMQDSLITMYKENSGTISKQDLDKLRNNLWVMAAAKIAPSNLVIRQWCLIDLFSRQSKHKKEIKQMVSCLSYGGEIWAEGYSYWQYTKSILDFWSDRFKYEEVSILIGQIDDGFVKTAYRRESVWYPAPFGDVRNEPLSENLISKCWNQKNSAVACTVANIKTQVTDSSVVYWIKGAPVGLNVHIPKNSYMVEVVGGFPKNFVFYTGYQNKYKNKEEELRDITDEWRVYSIGKCK